MPDSRLVSTGRAAELCQVTPRALNNWIREGKLRAYTTPGGHYRIRLLDLEEFLHRHGMPPLEAAGASPSGRPRVLVVDDDEGIVEIMSTMIAELGNIEISTADNGFNAGLEIARFRPDLVTLDLVMPYVDGYKVCQTIKSAPETRDTRVLVVTGFTEEGFIQRALDSGADAWLGKPFTRQELQDKVRQLLPVTQAGPGAGKDSRAGGVGGATAGETTGRRAGMREALPDG